MGSFLGCSFSWKNGKFGVFPLISGFDVTDRGSVLPDIDFFIRRILTGVVLAVTLSGCAGQDALDGTYDPAEPANRAVHQINKGLDTVVLKPVSQIYGAVTPDPVEDMVSNAARNLGEPADVINHFLQGDPKAAFVTVGRFGINTTIGIAGLFDPASSMGLSYDDTDFGETLHKWGAGEGAYVELPLFGPSNVRDTAGRIVDFLIDPVNTVVKLPERDYVTAAKVLEIVDTRHRYSQVVDSVLYETTDSYSTARNAYLQNRRSKLKGDTDEDDLEDPFEFE